MTSNELRQKYLDFFKTKQHAIISSASLIPENDPSVLFTMAGMHPLVPYLLGGKNPQGTRLVDFQKCIRTGDIDDVGDNRHLTFFEMMGNWSLGDYFKREAITWSFEFLTSKDWLGLDPKRLYVSVFRGEGTIPADLESIEVWKEQFQSAGITAEVSMDGKWDNENTRIFALGKDDNWWGLATGGPCGPCSEMFYDTAPDKHADTFEEAVSTGIIIEVWNDVFMEFNNNAGELTKLAQKNVDTGMGLERTTAVLNGLTEVFEIDEFQEIFRKIEELTGKKYVDDKREFRIIMDHVRAATFILGDEKGIEPSNVDQGYVLRRLIRRAVRYGKQLGINEVFTFKIAEVVIAQLQGVFPELKKNKEFIINQLIREEEKFAGTLEKGLREFKKMSDNKVISGTEAFVLFSTYGFPFEMTVELAKENGVELNKEEFDAEFKKHQALSRSGAEQKFKGGLADTGEMSVKYHTTTHLLLAALRQLLSSEIYQKGSNITAERLRFDFNYPDKLTAEQIKQVEDLVNEKIQANIPVEMSELPKEDALKLAKVSFDPSKYGDIVKVYLIGDPSNSSGEPFSIELCGGPHVSNTGELGKFKIAKEESSSAGVRRIKAVLE